ncbi:hypothetical protein UY3_03714 [Chelonia mydas]|uniref:Uncharacterized protein n=1 Tax=Chelonia mydas TaxID=8469 RepID=M7BTF5_CHEMY|nr:hypothetical protein UY3_03714 [Chelonia mydas]
MLSNIIRGLRHFRATFRCASALVAYGPDAFVSSSVVGSDLGTAFHSIDTPISHACTLVDVDLAAGTYGADVGTGPLDSGGSCECAYTTPSDETVDDADACSDTYGPGTVSSTTSSNAAPGVM